MAITHFAFTTLALLALYLFMDCEGTTNNSSVKPTLDSKRRHDLVDEAFSEQKDVLLEMLETKLKEMRDKKKRKTERSDLNNSHLEPIKCETLPNNVDIKLKANGLSAIGEAGIALKFGKSGKGTLNLDATGISNVGKAQLDLGVGDGTVHIPGLENLFVGHNFQSICDSQTETNIIKENKPNNESSDVNFETKRNERANEPNNTTNLKSGNIIEDNYAVSKKDDNDIEVTTLAIENNSTIKINNDSEINNSTATK